jgi:hypothetical protein
MDGSGISEIGIERFAGFGPSPSFSFTARVDGRYNYEGRRYIEPLGERSGRFPEWLFARLENICSELKILDLDDLYEAHFDDLPIMLLKIQHAGGIKLIRNMAGDICPPSLWGFAILIEHAMRQAFECEESG